jgi:hypothetical protein
VFLLELTCPPEDYDILMDPDKSSAQFQVKMSSFTETGCLYVLAGPRQDWDLVHSLFHTTLAAFLTEHGLASTPAGIALCPREVDEETAIEYECGDLPALAPDAGSLSPLPDSAGHQSSDQPSLGDPERAEADSFPPPRKVVKLSPSTAGPSVLSERFQYRGPSRSGQVESAPAVSQASTRARAASSACLPASKTKVPRPCVPRRCSTPLTTPSLFLL